MVAFGFGEVIGGFTHGILIDKIGSKKAVIVNLFILVAAIASTIVSLQSLEYNNYTFLMCFMWGYEDGSLNIFLFQILGFEVKKFKSAEAFGCFSLLQGLSVFCC
jgi:predicted MFS family arabinose efflux permease